ncbi:hypothetical protein GSU68_19260 (plasmid) [Rathayibacter sp. VKM Ac-2759]|uniref:hypothetical protein n=1 Tax=Rathayibacter sp. VKM Ac-2759 TaxID=2609252 RepID=UPI001317F362|nr:hypothetical protein [Rathayibacter sp. VKM Ac-2759]QHC68856.1 hypothetical protein GSU68_19260 [Rathayibacter sp. VKM Ac-2759]
MDFEAVDIAELVPVALASLTTLAATGIGFLLAGLNERRRDTRAAKQAAAAQVITAQEERTARKEDREVAAATATHQLRLEVVLQLQEALQRTARLVGRAMLHDQEKARDGEFGSLPDGLDEELFNNAVLLAKLRERILDEELRREVQIFHDRSVALSLNPQLLYGNRTPQQLARRTMELLGNWNEDVERVMKHVGAAVRTEMEWKP